MPKIYIQLKDLPDFKAGTEWEETNNIAVKDRVSLVINVVPYGDEYRSFPTSTFSEWFKEKKEKKEKRWRAVIHGPYYFIGEHCVDWHREHGDDVDNQSYSTGNYFQTREEAERCYQEYILPAFKKYWEDRGMEV